VTADIAAAAKRMYDAIHSGDRRVDSEYETEAATVDAEAF
jgi:hypothetical protein